MEFLQQILGFLSPVFEAYAGKFGFAVAFLSWVATARLIVKPTMAWLHSIAEATESKKDDAIVEKIETSAIYKVIVFILDWLASIKIVKP